MPENNLENDSQNGVRCVNLDELRKISRSLGDSGAESSNESHEVNRRLARYTGWLTFFTFWLFVATVALGWFAAKQAHDMKKAIQVSIGATTAATQQAQAAVDQLTLAFPPRLDLVDIHIWEKGQGHPLDPNNAAPTLNEGTKIEGAAFIVNFGRETAHIYSSDIVAGFYPSPITMFYPGWGNPGQNQLRVFKDDHPNYTTGEIAVVLAPGEQARWQLEKIIGKRKEGEEFYVIGNVAYTDRLKTRHGIYFVRRYDPATKSFVRIAGRDKDVEEK